MAGCTLETLELYQSRGSRAFPVQLDVSFEVCVVERVGVNQEKLATRPPDFLKYKPLLLRTTSSLDKISEGL